MSGLKAFFIGNSYTIDSATPSSTQSKLCSISPDTNYLISGLFVQVSINNNFTDFRNQTQISFGSNINRFVYNVTSEIPTDVAYPGTIIFDGYWETTSDNKRNQYWHNSFKIPIIFNKSNILYLHSYSAGTIPTGIILTVLTRVIVYAVEEKR